LEPRGFAAKQEMGVPTFVYKARNATGTSVSGTIVADTTAGAARLLDERALLPIEVEEMKAGSKSVLTGQTRRISSSKVGVLYEQLADLLRAGVPVLRALSVLSKQGSEAGLGRVLREVHDDVADGDTLADALDKHPHAFRTLHASMVRAGEKGGFLEDVLTRLSEFVARQDALRNKFIGALIYPCVLLSAGLIAVIGLMIFVVPQIRPMLMKQDLPWITQAVFGLSDFIGSRYLEIGGVLLLTIVGLYAFFQSRAGRRAWSVLQLRSPGLGKIYTMVALCRFCRIFGTLMANGIPILTALKISRESAGNDILSEMIDKAAESVNKGEPLSAPLAAARVFPAAIVDMLAVAEESNTLEKVLVQIANTQEERTARQIDLFAKLLEPMLLLVMGVMVLLVAVALLLPILRMATSGLH
jgi:general secretion pathway protein F